MDSINSLVLTNRFISDLLDIIEYIKAILCNEKVAEDFYMEVQNKKNLILKLPHIGTIVENNLIKKNIKLRKIPINTYNLYYYYDETQSIIYFVDIQSMLKSDKDIAISIIDFFKSC